MFKKHGVAYAVAAGVRDVDFMAAVVFVQVTYIVATGTVGSPCLTDAGIKVGFNFAAQRGEWMCIVVVLPPKEGVCQHRGGHARWTE